MNDNNIGGILFAVFIYEIIVGVPFLVVWNILQRKETMKPGEMPMKNDLGMKIRCFLLVVFTNFAVILVNYLNLRDIPGWSCKNGYNCPLDSAFYCVGDEAQIVTFVSICAVIFVVIGYLLLEIILVCFFRLIKRMLDRKA